MPKGEPIDGKKVKKLRRLRHLTQASLAQKIGGSVENIKRIERGEMVPVGIELMPRLAEALGVLVDEIAANGEHGDWIDLTPLSNAELLAMRTKINRELKGRTRTKGQ